MIPKITQIKIIKYRNKELGYYLRNTSYPIYNKSLTIFHEKLKCSKITIDNAYSILYIADNKKLKNEDFDIIDAISLSFINCFSLRHKKTKKIIYSEYNINPSTKKKIILTEKRIQEFLDGRDRKYLNEFLE